MDKLQQLENKNFESSLLSKYTKIFMPRFSSSKTEESILVKVIKIKDLTPTINDFDTIDEMQIDSNIEESMFLRENDVILACRGVFPMKISIIKNLQDIKCTALNIVVIRVVNDCINPDFLKIYLESPKMTKIFESLIKGENIKYLCIKDLLNIKIPKFPKDVQNNIAEEYLSEQSEYKMRLKEIEERWNSAKQKIYQKIN